MRTASWQQRSRRASGGAGVLGFVLAAAAALQTAPAAADRLVFHLQPAAVRFTLGATLHEVEGEIDLVSGEIAFDPAGGACTGEVVLDARSADTDNDRRDAKLHGEALESERFPKIVYRPTHLRVRERTEMEASVELEGELELHGTRRPFGFEARIVRDDSATGPERALGRPVKVEAGFDVRYVDWGVADVSSFLLRVDDHVRVNVRALGRWVPDEDDAAADAPTPARAP